MCKTNYKIRFLRYHRMISTMIPYQNHAKFTQISLTCDIIGTFHMLLPLILLTYDVNAVWYHIFLWYCSPWHGICSAGWLWLGAPLVRSSPPTNWGTSVHLNTDWLDPVKVMRCDQWFKLVVVVKKSPSLCFASATQNWKLHTGSGTRVWVSLLQPKLAS